MKFILLFSIRFCIVGFVLSVRFLLIPWYIPFLVSFVSTSLAILLSYLSMVFGVVEFIDLISVLRVVDGVVLHLHHLVYVFALFVVCSVGIKSSVYMGIRPANGWLSIHRNVEQQQNNRTPRHH